MKTARFFWLLFTILIVSGCASNDSINSDSEDKINIYTTIYPLEFIVNKVASDTVNTKTVYPPGVDEHTYEPTSKDLTDIADGDAFFYIGAGLEAFAQTAADALENQQVKLIEIGLHEELFLHNDDHEHDDHGHDHGQLDPHVWLDPLRMIKITEIIKSELIEMNPEDKELYEKNAELLEAELKQLDTEFQQLLDTKKNKKLLVTHEAFGYWEDRYGIEQIAIHGLSTENEPSQRNLIEIIERAQEHNINHLIFEQNVTTNVAEIIQEEIGAEGLIIHNLAILTEDDINRNRDYLSIMRDNLAVLNKALNE